MHSCITQNAKTEEVSNRNVRKCAQKYKCLKIQFPISFKILSLLNKYKVQHTSRHGYETKVSEHSSCSSCPATQSCFPSEVSSASSPSFSTRPFLNSLLWRLVVYSSKVLPPNSASRGILPPVMSEEEDVNK